MNEDNIIIECSNVSKRFNFFFAIKNISFKVKKNTIFGILGANGAGKTTLLRILSGLSTPTRGEVNIDNFNFRDHPKRIKEKIGVLVETSFLYEELSMHENLKFYLNLRYSVDKKEINAKISEYANQFDLSDWIFEPINTLSKGMRQKVEIMRVLMSEPSILLLDEPFSGLDFRTRNLLVRTLQNAQKEDNRTIILTTHNIDVASQICDEILILKKGRINCLLTDRNLKSSYIESHF